MKKRVLSFLLALTLTLGVTAFAATLGDVTGDGTVNLKDVTKLFQYVNKQIDTLGDADGDITGDGEINLKDVTKLFQYVNKQIDSLSPAPDATPTPTPPPSTDENGSSSNEPPSTSPTPEPSPDPTEPPESNLELGVWIVCGCGEKFEFPSDWVTHVEYYRKQLDDWIDNRAAGIEVPTLEELKVLLLLPQNHEEITRAIDDLTSQGAEGYFCSICGDNFDTTQAMWDHEDYAHPAPQPHTVYVCRDCGHRSYSTSEQDEHKNYTAHYSFYNETEWW